MFKGVYKIQDKFNCCFVIFLRKGDIFLDIINIFKEGIEFGIFFYFFQEMIILKYVLVYFLKVNLFLNNF